jgi:hypothetical protein
LASDHRLKKPVALSEVKIFSFFFGFLCRPVWIDLIFRLCETTYANKYNFMYYYKFLKVICEKAAYKDTIFVIENI